MPRVMQTIDRGTAMRSTAHGWRRAGETIGFVPTMGALHAGHVSLVERARAECHRVVVSIFVNPLQFGPSEDLARYPRDLEGDRRLLEAAGVDALFTTTPAEMYRAGFQTHVVPGELSLPLCGARRPGHFRGVTTVVAKLFHLVVPHQAYFGQKDFQQARVLQQMVADLDFDLRLRILPTHREPDGLAMSSRNRYLSTDERREAPELHRSLAAVRAAFDAGERDPRRLAEAGRTRLANRPAFRLDYLDVLDDETLAAPDRLATGGVVAVAVFLGTTRLIDNVLLGSAEQRLG